MTTDLANWAMTPSQVDALFGAGTFERFQLEVWHKVVNEGRAARFIGRKLHDCPPFVDENMAVSWRIGWYDEDKRQDPKGFALRESVASQVESATAERRARDSRSRVRNFICPKCGALPGRACISANNKPLPDEHAARRKGAP